MELKPNHLTKKKLQQIWAQVPPNYYDEGIAKNIFQKIWHGRKLAKVLDFLPNAQTRLKVLDIGCSSGVLTAEIAKVLPPKSQVVGLDSYQKAITFARSKYPDLTFTTADAHKLPFNNKTFDLVICTETLEHLVDPQKALLEIKRVLKRDGRAIISMDSGSLLFKIIWHFWTKTRGKVWQNAHLHEFSAALLESLIKNNGFKIKKKISSHFGMAVTFLASPS